MLSWNEVLHMHVVLVLSIDPVLSTSWRASVVEQERQKAFREQSYPLPIADNYQWIRNNWWRPCANYLRTTFIPSTPGIWTTYVNIRTIWRLMSEISLDRNSIPNTLPFMVFKGPGNQALTAAYCRVHHVMPLGRPIFLNIDAALRQCVLQLAAQPDR